MGGTERAVLADLSAEITSHDSVTKPVTAYKPTDQVTCPVELLNLMDHMPVVEFQNNHACENKKAVDDAIFEVQSTNQMGQDGGMAVEYVAPDEEDPCSMISRQLNQFGAILFDIFMCIDLPEPHFWLPDLSMSTYAMLGAGFLILCALFHKWTVPMAICFLSMMWND